MPHFSGKADLPVLKHLPQIREALETHRTAILSAPPGAGKTTQVPPALLEEPWLGNKTIVLLEPRRLAAVSCAGRMADLLGEPLGRTIGYQIRMDKKISSATRIRVVTEGIFTRMIQADPSLENIGLVIFDEFHERHLQTDLGLALCLDARDGLRPDLRILVMSATMDILTVTDMLQDSPIITSRGKTFPVKTTYLPQKPQTRSLPIENACAGAIQKAMGNTRGDMLVFLPGVKEIRRLSDILLSWRRTDIRVIPLYGSLTPREQAAAFTPAPGGKRKIVIATSIAETSITIPGIRVVIDSGLMRVPRLSPASGMTRLETVPVSRASADQRRGRAGRLESGVCFRLWSPHDHQSLQPFSLPEIHCIDLSGLVLELAAWGVHDPGMLRWPDPPKPVFIDQGKELLIRLGAIDDSGRITPHGRQMAGAGLHPRLSHMILAARPENKGYLACRLAACLMERDFVRFDDGYYDPDIRLRLEIIESVEKKDLQKPDAAGINKGIIFRILESEKKIARDFKIRKEPVDLHAAGELLARAYPDRIARKRDNSRLTFQMANGKGIFFPSANSLSTYGFIVAVHLDGHEKNARIFLGAPLDETELLDDFKAGLTSRRDIFWDDKTGQIRAMDQVLLDRLVVKQSPADQIDAQKALRILTDYILDKGLQILPWTKEMMSIRSRCRFLAGTGRFDALPDLSDAWLAKNLDTWLMPFLDGVTSLAQLSLIDLNGAFHSLLSWKQLQVIEKNAPTHIVVPSGSRRPLKYEPGQKTATSPVLAVRLQEMFGLTKTPAVAGGTVLVSLHLLSPAGRVVQITQDINSFWENTYPDVKRDLMGRYPKHFWPDDPVSARPTRRAKPQKRP